MTTCLYRAFNADDVLLYVGITNSGLSRFHQHRATGWWHDVTHVTVTHFDERREAMAAELQAIATEHPVHNIVGVAGRGPVVQRSRGPVVQRSRRSRFGPFLQRYADESARRIQERRITTGLTIEALADVVGDSITVRQLSRIEVGDFFPRNDVKQRIAKALVCKVNDIYPTWTVAELHALTQTDVGTVTTTGGQ